MAGLGLAPTSPCQRAGCLPSTPAPGWAARGAPCLSAPAEVCFGHGSLPVPPSSSELSRPLREVERSWAEDSRLGPGECSRTGWPWHALALPESPSRPVGWSEAAAWGRGMPGP